jgi:hypothetical protein
MSLRKFLTLLFALTLVLAVACGKGKEVVDEEDLGEDDGALQTAAADTAGGATAAPAAAAPAVADAATINGLIKFEAAAPPKMPTLQMGADPFCASQHPTPEPDEEVVLGPAGELANVIVYVKNAPAGSYPTPGPTVLDQKGCKYKVLHGRPPSPVPQRLEDGRYLHHRQPPAGQLHPRRMAREVRPAGAAGDGRSERAEAGAVYVQGVARSSQLAALSRGRAGLRAES